MTKLAQKTAKSAGMEVRAELATRIAARAITWLRDNYAKRLHMEELAEIVRMGVSTLHRHSTISSTH